MRNTSFVPPVLRRSVAATILCAAALGARELPAQGRAISESELRQLTTHEILAIGKVLRSVSGPLLLSPPKNLLRQHRSFLSLPSTGLTRLLPRGEFVHAVEERQGGAYWSFLRRTHAYSGDSDLSLENDAYTVGFAGSDTGVILDLGDQPLDRIDRSRRPDGIHEPVWALLWTRSDGEPRDAHRQFLSRQRALEAPSRADAREGHTYLLRSVHAAGDDVLVVFKTVEVDDRGHTILWRVLEGSPRSARPSVGRPGPTANSPLLRRFGVRLSAMSLERLLESAEVIRRTVHRRLTSIPDQLPAEQQALLASDGVHGARIVRRFLFDHVTLKGERGPAYYSFATRTNDYDAEPDLELTTNGTWRQMPRTSTDPAGPQEKLTFSTGFYGGTTGYMVDLGQVDLLTLRADPQTTPAGTTPEIWELLRRDIGTSERSYDRSFDADARKLGLRDDVPAVVGHTYLVRAVLPGEHDHLVAFTALEDDSYGFTLAWRVLHRWTLRP